jgi:hypothetical protein
MHHLGVTELLELFVVGLLAGFEVAVHYGIGVPPSALTESAQIILRQALVRRLRVLAPVLFVPSLVLAIMIAVNERNEPQSWLRYIAVSMLLVWMIIRIARTVPVNSATLEWNPEAPPRDWRSLVQRTEQFHVVAAWAAVVAFLTSLASGFSFWSR